MTWRIPGYVAEELIGYGSSSEVWRARSTRTGQSVALKKVLCADREQLRAAHREAELLAALDHPNLIRLHGAVRTSDALVLALDLADAGSLRDLLHARGALTSGEVASALAPVGAALAYAHGRRVVHGDVSTGNVLFTAFGLSLLADLGVGRLVENDTSVQATAASVAPEVASGSIAGAPSDVFSLAAVVFHALTGSAVWAGAGSEEMMATARNGDLPDLATALAGVEPSLVKLLSKALTTDVHRRPSAADFALELRLAVPWEPIELTAGRPRPVPLPPAGGRHRKVAVQSRPSEPGRPRFERPPATAIDRGQLTRGVRIALAQPPPRRVHGRMIAALLTGLIVVASAVAGGCWYFGRPAEQRVASPDFAGRLAALDALRQQAFAERRPELLERVYSTVSLREQDAELIGRLVPAGCGLMGVHTIYRNVRAESVSADGAELTASAVLTPSTLRCGTATTASAPGLTSTPMRISLARTGQGYLIAQVRTGT
jgi:hypothetical protein